MKTIHRLLLLTLLALICGACVPAWTVIRQAPGPNPLHGKATMALEPLSFAGLHVGQKTEADYQSKKSGEQQSSWQTDKTEMAQNFAAELQARSQGLATPGAAGGGKHAVRARIVFIEPGFYAYVAAHPTEAVMRLQVLAPGGEVLDEIEARVAVEATMVSPSSGGRMREAGTRLGGIAADYLLQRVAQP